MQFQGNNFALNVPDDWQDRSVISFVAKVAPNEFAPNVVITSEPVGENVSIESYAKRQFAVTQAEVDGLKVLEQNNIEIGGRPAVQTIQKITAHGLNLQQLQTFLLAEKQVFVITCTTTSTNFNQHLTNFQKLIESFRIK